MLRGVECSALRELMQCDSTSWRESRFAPSPGTSLGALDAIPDRSVREFQFGEGRRIFSMLVVRRGDAVRAYVNACPHVWLPLTFRSAQLLSADGERLVCSNHLAEFAVDDGRALSGPVEPGCGLDAIPVHVNDDRVIVIGPSPLPPPAPLPWTERGNVVCPSSACGRRAGDEA